LSADFIEKNIIIVILSSFSGIKDYYRALH